MSEPILMGWSGGKDSALSVQALRCDPALHIHALLTTITDDYDRISMHGVRRTLLQMQTKSLGLPLIEVRIPIGCDNATYEAKMEEVLLEAKAEGVRRCAFGDLFLQDIREYRDRQLARVGMTGIYPVWGIDTHELARRFIADGFKTILVCVDPNKLDSRFCGREFDASLLEELPESVDPCGENGEFHTFVYDGPIFKHPVAVRRGEVLERDGFWYCDLLPEGVE